MKQMKFFLVALMAVVMSVSVTSCMNGENNTKITDYPIIGRVTENMLTFKFVSLDGYTYNVQNVVTDALNFYTGDYIIASCSYDTETDIDLAAKTVNVTVSAAEKISGNAVYPTTLADDEGETPSYASNRGVYSVTDAQPAMIDNNNLLAVIRYFAFEKRDSHTFSMVYYTDETEMKDKTELKVYLRHNSSEDVEKETYQDIVYRVFNLSGPLGEFYRINGTYPTKITIVAETNTTNAKVPDSTTSVSLNYTRN